MFSGQQPGSLASAPRPPGLRCRGWQEPGERPLGLLRPRQLPATGPLPPQQLTHTGPAPREALSRLRKCKSALRGAVGRSSDSAGERGGRGSPAGLAGHPRRAVVRPPWGARCVSTLVFRGGGRSIWENDLLPIHAVGWKQPGCGRQDTHGH